MNKPTLRTLASITCVAIASVAIYKDISVIAYLAGLISGLLTDLSDRKEIQ